MPLRLSASWLCVGLLLILGGCASVPGGRGADGPPVSAGPDPMQVPDAEPRVEPIRPGGANKPYEVLGQSYVPITSDQPLTERGLASWYGRKFHGRRTASGETYNMNAMTAAHKTMPIPSYARVRNPANGREVVVRINDRGPFSASRVIDLSWAAAVRLGVQNGVAPVEVQRLTNDEIQAGLGGRRAPPPTMASVVPAAELAFGGSAGVPSAVSSSVVQAQALMPSPQPSLQPSLQSSLQPAPLMPRSPAGASAAPSATLIPPIEPLPARARTRDGAGFWVQLGAFSRGEGALAFQQRVAEQLDWLSPLLTVFAEGGLHRLQAGPYASRDLAREAAERMRTALQLVPVLVERR